MNKIDERVYLDTYILQKDMRVRMPKEIKDNLNISEGETYFDVYINKNKGEIILKVDKNTSDRRFK